MSLPRLSQSPTDDAFVQDPYAFYDRARQHGDIVFWEDYDMPAAISHDAVSAILRDRRLGRTPPPGHEPEKPPHQAAFWAIEDHSMLELEPPRHTRLRRLVLHAFTSRRIAGLEPEIAALAEALIDKFPLGQFDLIPAFAAHLPVIIIARLLGVPETHAPQLLAWSHAMVAMYMAGRTRQTEERANRAAAEFAAFLSDYIDHRRANPADDLISELIAAEDDGKQLSRPELIATCVLLLNAGHEATVHTIGNGVLAMLSNGLGEDILVPDKVDATVEEILRFDTPLHLFDRWTYDDVEFAGHLFPAHTRIACLLGAANRDPARWQQPDRFDPNRPIQTNSAFGAGTHFCLGAPLARLELRAALPVLFRRCPELRIVGRPRFAPTFHFHGLERLEVCT